MDFENMDLRYFELLHALQDVRAGWQTEFIAVMLAAATLNLEDEKFATALAQAKARACMP